MAKVRADVASQDNAWMLIDGMGDPKGLGQPCDAPCYADQVAGGVRSGEWEPIVAIYQKLPAA